MLMCSGISVLFGKSKVNNVNQVSFLSQSHQKIVRFHITMNEIFGVDVLYPADLQQRSKYRYSEEQEIMCTRILQCVTLYFSTPKVNNQEYKRIIVIITE